MQNKRESKPLKHGTLETTITGVLRIESNLKSKERDRKMSYRVSSYSAFFQYPEIESSILLHGYTGAIDLVQDGVADLLGSGARVDHLPYALRRTLIDRGYLTQKNLKEEEAHVLSVLEVLQRKLEARTKFLIEPVLPAEATPQDARRIVDSYFEIMDGLKSSSSYREVTLDLRGGLGERAADFLDLAIAARNDWTLSAVTDGRDFGALEGSVDQHKIREVFVSSTFNDGEFGETLDGLTKNFARALNRDAIIVWLINPEELENGSLERLVDRAFEFKAKWPFGFSFSFISNSSTADSDGGASICGKYFSSLKLEEIPLYRRIKRFLDNPTLLINFEPCFYRGDLNVRFTDAKIYVSSALEREPIEAGDCQTNPTRVDYEKIEATKSKLGFGPIDKELASCPFCLICGCRADRSENDPDSESPCNGFGENLHRILPPLFYSA